MTLRTPPVDPVTIDLNPRERRLYDRMRARLIEPVADNKSGLGDLLLLLPDFTILLARLLRDPRIGLTSKAIAVAGLAYVISPIDVLPALLIGPVGLVDDLFVVCACLSRLLNHVHPDVVRSHWSGQGDALAAIQAVMGWFEGRLSRLSIKPTDLLAKVLRRRL